MNSFYTIKELEQIGFKEIGENIKISKKASIYSPETIELGNHVRIDDFCILSGKIKIGNYVHISAYTALYGSYGIEIGDYCGCSPRCTLFSATDDFSGEFMISPMVPEELTNVIGGTVKLKNFVQIGAGSIVMPKVTLEEGTVIGAMSFVKETTEAWNTYAGVPCKKIKERKMNIKELSKKIEGD